jgi:Icc protein
VRVLSIDEAPFHELAYQRVRSRGRGVEWTSLEVRRATVDVLPDSLDGLFLCSDLQGAIPGEGPVPLVGEQLAEELKALSLLGEIPEASRLGVVVAGDLYARAELDRRGGHGEVRSIWEAFASASLWVAGVAGNHDLVNGAFPSGGWHRHNMHLLDGEIVELSGLRIGGISGVVGEGGKPYHRDEGAFANLVKQLSGRGPDLLVLHEGPDDPAAGFPGNAAIRDALDGGLIVCGHDHWPQPLAELGGAQVLNVDGRGLLLIRR